MFLVIELSECRAVVVTVCASIINGCIDSEPTHAILKTKCTLRILLSHECYTLVANHYKLYGKIKEIKKTGHGFDDQGKVTQLTT